MLKKIKDLVRGDKIKFEYGDYDNWVTWTFERYEVQDNSEWISIYGYPRNSKKLDQCCHWGIVEDTIEVVDPVAEHCSKCGRPICVSDNKNYYRGKAFCDECINVHN